MSLLTIMYLFYQTTFYRSCITPAKQPITLNHCVLYKPNYNSNTTEQNVLLKYFRDTTSYIKTVNCCQVYCVGKNISVS